MRNSLSRSRFSLHAYHRITLVSQLVLVLNSFTATAAELGKNISTRDSTHVSTLRVASSSLRGSNGVPWQVERIQMPYSHPRHWYCSGPGTGVAAWGGGRLKAAEFTLKR